MLVGGWMQSIEDAGSGDERATTGWEEAFAFDRQLWSFGPKARKPGEEPDLGQSAGAGVGKQQ
jgi:hypothetical protein